MGNLDCNEGRQEHGTDTGPATQRAALQTETGPHTPGPWRVDPDLRAGMEYNNHVITQSGDRICFMAHAGEERQPEFDANARLIAAAPELLAALQCFISDARFHVAVGGNPIVVDRMLDTARAAIAKATGGKS